MVIDLVDSLDQTGFLQVLHDDPDDAPVGFLDFVGSVAPVEFPLELFGHLIDTVAFSLCQVDQHGSLMRLVVKRNTKV